MVARPAVSAHLLCVLSAGEAVSPRATELNAQLRQQGEEAWSIKHKASSIRQAAYFARKKRGRGRATSAAKSTQLREPASTAIVPIWA